MFEEKDKHDSFGQIRWSRQHGGPDQLYGSELRHNQQICITIYGSEKHRELSKSWYFEKEIIAEVVMSQSQFAEFMTTPNASAIPCTIKTRGDREGKDRSPVYPGHVSEKELHQNEFKKDISGAMDQIKLLTEHSEEILNGRGTMSVAEREKLSSHLNKLSMALHDAIPFVNSSFQKAMAKTVEHGKQEIEAFAGEAMRRHGLDAIEELKDLKPPVQLIAQSDEIEQNIVPDIGYVDIPKHFSGAPKSMLRYVFDNNGPVHRQGIDTFVWRKGEFDIKSVDMVDSQNTRITWKLK